MIIKYQNRKKQITLKIKVKDESHFREDFYNDEESWTFDELVIKEELYTLITNLLQVLKDEPFLIKEEVKDKDFWWEEVFIEEEALIKDLIIINLRCEFFFIN